MNDMTPVIVPKSDQISADDFIAGPRTYTIEDIEIRPGTEQPVSIFLAGEPRAWKPCKSMSRCLVAAWGPDANIYKGRGVTLYRDPKVKWGGMEVGGIRISHMSHIERDMMLQLTATKGKRAPHIVKPLPAPSNNATDKATDWTRDHLEAINNASDADDLAAVIKAGARALPKLERDRPELHAQVAAAYAARQAELASDDPFGGPTEGKPDDQAGEGFTDHEAPYAATITDIMARIDKAIGEASWDAAKDEYTKHMMALPREVAGTIEAALQAKKVELGL